MFTSHSRQIVTLAMRYRLPSAYELRDFAVAGGLLSYGPTTGERWEQVAHHLKTAKALDLAIPHSVLLRADEVIQ
jgi:putative ABC transport system substrate-binding protein